MDTLKLEPPFLLAFERAAMDSRIPYFYYPTDQLPEAIRGLYIGYGFRYGNIPSHFDALVFIREAKATRDSESYPRRYGLWKSVKDITLHHEKLLKELDE